MPDTIEATLQAKSLDAPDEERPFGHGRMRVVQLGATTVGRGTFEPGWRWSQDVKPIAGTDSCQAHHTIYVLSGRMGDPHGRRQRARARPRRRRRDPARA